MMKSSVYSFVCLCAVLMMSSPASRAGDLDCPYGAAFSNVPFLLVESPIGPAASPIMGDHPAVLHLKDPDDASVAIRVTARPSTSPETFKVEVHSVSMPVSGPHDVIDTASFRKPAQWIATLELMLSDRERVDSPLIEIGSGELDWIDISILKDAALNDAPCCFCEYNACCPYPGQCMGCGGCGICCTRIP
jgi:hypothetical protein